MNIIIFDLEIAGHHPGYIGHLLCYWPDPNITLTLVVSPEFLQAHDDVVQTKSNATVVWSPVKLEELQWYRSSKHSLLRQSWIEWQLFCRYAKEVKADQGLVMYIDRFQLPLALCLPIPCPISGIYFRPKFHYVSFENHRLAKGEWLKALREQLLWRSALRHPKLKMLFCLDPLAVEPLNRLVSQNKVVHLPDPVEFSLPLSEDVINLKKRLGIDTKRKIFLLFGAIDQRKGVYQVLSAIEQLSKPVQKSITLLLVGQVSPYEKERLGNALRRSEKYSAVQVILHDEYVTEVEIPLYFAMADVVLALYQQHVGSSSILLWAAAAEKPVLASDYGLMGELVKRHQLGDAIDSSKLHEVAIGIERSLNEGRSNMFDSKSARAFSQNNSAKHFTETIEKNLETPLKKMK